MNLRYRCLILDHDDTAVRSTPQIHYKSFIKALEFLRPNMEPLSLEKFILYCFEPGFSKLCKDIIGFNDKEIEYQYAIWQEYTNTRIPEFYPGFIELLNEYKELGGIVTVVSHSEKDRIERDYKNNGDLIPDLIFGWELEESKRKPSQYPIKQIIKEFDLEESDVLVVDDLKPGLDMARSCDVAFAGVGWSHDIKEIENFMIKNANYYFKIIEDFRDTIFIG